MNCKNLVLLFIIFSCISTYAQESFDACGTDLFTEFLQEQNPEWIKTNTILEKKYVHDLSNSYRSSLDSICLPVVVHVIHNDGAENISDAQVLNGIKNLNDAFANVGYYNPDTGVDTKIQFCLAQRDTSANAINGILRHASIYTDMSISGSFNGLLNIAILNPEEYINIHIVKDACVNGACYPAGFAGANRIVVEAQYFGVSERDDTVLTHEMGHFLGLYHTFKGGCKNNDCLTGGDKVCDTPPDNQNFEHCFSERNSCTSDDDDLSDNNPYRPINLGGQGDQNDSHHNYMDYNWWECYDQFSQGQVDRMHWFIENRYSSLQESKSCFPPCENIASALFISLLDSVEVGSSLNFTDLSSNATSYSWTIDDIVFSNAQNSSFVFSTEGLFTINLEVWNDDEACETDVYSIDIVVYCPVEACINYEIQGQYVYFNNCASTQGNNTWLILNGNNDTLDQSKSLDIDSFYVNNIAFVQLCLTTDIDICQDYNCQFIDIITDGTEICDNQKDDDDDGLVDLFDPDCPCTDEAYQAQCEIDCQYIPNPSFDFGMKIKWKSSDLVSFSSNLISYYSHSDNTSHVGGIYTDRTDLWNPQSYLRVFDGNSGFLISDRFLGVNYTRLLATARLNPMEEVNYFTMDSYGYKRFNASLDLILSSDLSLINQTAPINFADFNSDGKAEIYLGNTIFNAESGDILLEDVLSKGTNANSSRHIGVAGDFLPSPGLELAIGNVIYDIDIVNSAGEIGNTLTAQIANSPVTDGFTSAGDIDGDGELDVIVVSGNDNQTGKGIWVWNPRTLNLIASDTAPSDRGGVAFIGDVDNDCLSEIGMTFKNELRVYKYDGTEDLVLMYSLLTTDNSGITGITIFDFNQDGKNEIIYRDQTDLRIIEGATGITLGSIPMKSGTALESPIVVDIDIDGKAEILVSGYETDSDSTYIYCIESDGTTWAPARSVWNQYSYNPTMVNDDLTIPRYPQNPAKPLQGTENCLQETCNTPYNNFMVQATYRTQAGCVVWPAIDLSLDIINYSCAGDSLEIDLVIYNDADYLDVEDTICINWYMEDLSPSNVLEISCMPIVLDTESSSDTLHFSIAMDGNSVDQILASITDVLGNTFEECNYLNNLDSIRIDLSVPSLDLGPDIIKCNSEVISFNVGAGFESYLWSDLSADSIFSTSFPGLHFVELTDRCGSVLRDTVEFTLDSIDDIDLGVDLLLCDQDSMEIVIPADYDFVNWYPSDKVSCSTCHATKIHSTEPFELVVQVGKGNCISLDTVAVDIIIPEIVEQSAQICDGEQYQYLDSTWMQAGFYTYQHPSCDTVFNLNLEVNLLDTTYQNSQICSGDSLFFDNTWLKTEGEYTSTLSDLNNCDSLLVLTLSVYDQLISNDSAMICPGDSIFYHNQWVSQSGTNEIATLSSGGCDSTIYLDLSYHPEYSMPDQIWLCPGDSIMYNNEWVYTDESYVFDLNTSEGCDSIISLTVNEYDAFSVMDSIWLCPGDSIMYNDVWVLADNDYVLSEQTINGCDSIINLRVNEYDTYAPADSTWLCVGDSILIQGNWIYTDFEYQEAFNSSQGCDSIFQYSILFEAVPDAPVIDFDCDAELIELSVNADGWDVLWDNGEVTSSTQYTGEQTVGVSLTSTNNCVVSYLVDLPSTPDLSGLSALEDVVLNVGDSLVIDLGLDMTDWDIVWSSSEILSCDTCSQLIICPDESTELSVNLIHNSGCSYEYSFFITLSESENYYIPNAFSPNGDGQNDDWQVFFNTGSGLSVSQGSIYDRWGNQVKSWKNTSDISWDGKLNDRDLEQGVYIFILKLIDAEDGVIEVSGDLTLLR